MTEIKNISQVSSFTIRVEFSDYCYAVNESNSNDSLNLNNYQISGPGNITIEQVSPVTGFPKSFDLNINGDLGIGKTWNVRASNISDIYGNTVNSIFSFISQEFTSQILTSSAVNEMAEDVLRKFINPKLVGKVWSALISALATGEQTNWDNAQYAFDQLFFSSASGDYLKQRGSDYGVNLPKNVGFSDEIYREYINNIVNKQLTLNSINELINIFYGDDATCATVISGTYNIFSLNDQDDLLITLDGGDQISIIFETEDFENITNATVLEICDVFNNYFEIFQKNAFAVPYIDPETSQTYLKLFSGTIGLKSSIEINGGLAQNALKFPTVIDAYTSTGSLPTWNISQTNTNTFRFETTTSPTSIDLTNIFVGNYVNITGSEFNQDNRGSFIITKVYVSYPLTQYFEISTINGAVQTVTQVALNSIQFYNTYTVNTYDSPNAAFASQNNKNQLNITLPVSSNLIERQSLTGAYLTDYPTISINSGNANFSLLNNSENTINLTISNSLTNQIITGQIEGVTPDFTKPATTTGIGLNIDVSPVTIFSNLNSNPITSSPLYSVKLIQNISILTDGYNMYSLTMNGNSYVWHQGTNSGTIKQELGISTILFGSASFVTGGSYADVEQNETFIIYPNCLYLNRANLNTARFSHGQCELSSGKILVCGGVSTVSGALSSVEIYDPTLNTWTNVTSMNIARYGHSTVLLNNGKVLVFGGSDSTFTAICTSEIYDPLLNTWTIVGSRTYSDENPVNRTVKLNDGRIFVVGAYGFIPSQSSTAASHLVTEIFDPNNNTWSVGPSIIPNISSDGSNISVSNLLISYVYDSAINFERIIAINIQNGIYTQYLDIAHTGALSNYPLNNIDYKWHKSAQIVASTSNISSCAVDGNKILVTGSVNGVATSYLYVANSDQWGVAKLSQRQQNLNISGTSITLNNPEIRIPSSFITTNGTVKPNTSVDIGLTGPYIWDPSNGFEIGYQSCTLTENLYKGQSYSQITVDNTSGFPSSGYLVFNFGFDDNIVGQYNLIYPLKYNSIISSTVFQTDTSFIFPETVSSSSVVTLVVSTQPVDPINALSLGSFYLTDSSAARIATQNGINRIVAGGINVNYNVKYPLDTGLGGSGFPTSGNGKLSDIVEIYDSKEDVDNDA